MSTAWRTRLCLLALLPLLSLRAAEAPPPAEGEPAAGETAPPAPSPAQEEEEEPPLEPISADNNLTFPVDI
ncbi:MAG: hypothetical protein M3Y79_15875 [Pseudomonadota bacterium]|nr:hypothetical protein [Pseudomonadota bacterium]